MCLATMVFDQPWILIPLTYGFWAHVLTGPTLSPLGQLATRVVAPRLPVEPKLVPGPPKRFAQAVGVLFSTTSLVLWFGFGEHTASFVVLGLLTCAAFLEAPLGLPGLQDVRVADEGRRHPRVGLPGVQRPLAPPPRALLRAHLTFRPVAISG